MIRQNTFFNSLNVATGGGGSSLLSGIQSYWNLDAANPPAVDSTGLASLTNYNITYNQTGIINKCYYYNGSGGSYTGLVYNAAYNFTNAMTLSFWMNTSTSGTFMDLITNWSSGDGTGWIVYKDTDDNVYYEVHDPAQSPANSAAISGSSQATGSWFHIVATFDGSNPRIYINNVIGSVVGTTWSHNIVYTTNNRFTFGANNVPANYYTGYLDEIGVWNRVLTSGEISTLYNSGAGKTYPFS